MAISRLYLGTVYSFPRSGHLGVSGRCRQENYILSPDTLLSQIQEGRAFCGPMEPFDRISLLGSRTLQIQDYAEFLATRVFALDAARCRAADQHLVVFMGGDRLVEIIDVAALYGRP